MSSRASSIGLIAITATSVIAACGGAREKTSTSKASLAASPRIWLSNGVLASLRQRAAKLFGLDHAKGSLRASMDADVVVFDPEAHRRLDASSLHMRTDHSPYEGMNVIGWPAFVFSRGRLVSRGGEPVDIDDGWGRFVPRRPTGSR